MIQERPDIKTLDPSDILERFNTREFQLSEKRDIYGPNYGRTRALKAKAAASSSEEEFECSSGDREDFLKPFFLVNFWNFFTSIASSFPMSSGSLLPLEHCVGFPLKRKG